MKSFYDLSLRATFACDKDNVTRSQHSQSIRFRVLSFVSVHEQRRDRFSVSVLILTGARVCNSMKIVCLRLITMLVLFSRVLVLHYAFASLARSFVCLHTFCRLLSSPLSHIMIPYYWLSWQWFCIRKHCLAHFHTHICECVIVLRLRCAPIAK